MDDLLYPVMVVVWTYYILFCYCNNMDDLLHCVMIVVLSNLKAVMGSILLYQYKCCMVNYAVVKKLKAVKMNERTNNSTLFFFKNFLQLCRH